MEKKKKSERDKYREIFAQIFKTSPEQDEIEELSKPANRVDQNLVDQNLVDQKMVYQKLVDQNLVDQNLDYSQVVDAIILSPFTPMTKFALTVFMLKSSSLEFTISINKAASMLRVSRTTVINMINELKRWNLVVKQGQSGTTISLYKLLGRPKSGRPKTGRPDFGRPLEEEEEDNNINNKYILPLPPLVVDQNLVDQNLVYPHLDPLAILIMNTNGIDPRKLDPSTLNALAWLYQQDTRAFVLVCYASRQSNINLKGFIRKTIRERRYENLSLEDVERATAIMEAAERFIVAFEKSVTDWLSEIGSEQATKDLSLLLNRPVLKHSITQEAEKLLKNLKNAIERYVSIERG